MGEKPLYYGTHENNFIFSSELKSFYELPNYSPELNLYSIKEFFNNSYIPAPKTIFNDIFKLSASSYLKINIHEDIYNIKPDLYWSAGTKNTFSEKSYNKNPNELDHLINDSVKQQMVADVPIGVFLSGGIDSSLIASYAKKNATENIKTFSVGFSGNKHNELPHAKKIAKYLGTDHHELMIDDFTLLDSFSKMGQIYDEPFYLSQAPTYLISKVAKEYVKVVLSGDGGDELFAVMRDINQDKNLNIFKYFSNKTFS